MQTQKTSRKKHQLRCFSKIQVPLNRKATLSRVYAVKGIDPVCLGSVLANFVPGFVFLEGKQGSMELKEWNNTHQRFEVYLK